MTTNAEGYYQYDWDSSMGVPMSVEDHVRVTPHAPGFVFSPPYFEMHLPGRLHDLHFVATRIEPQTSLGAVGISWTVVDGAAVDVRFFAATVQPSRAGAGDAIVRARARRAASSPR